MKAEKSEEGGRKTLQRRYGRKKTQSKERLEVDKSEEGCDAGIKEQG